MAVVLRHREAELDHRVAAVGEQALRGSRDRSTPWRRRARRSAAPTAPRRDARAPRRTRGLQAALLERGLDRVDALLDGGDGVMDVALVWHCGLLAGEGRRNIRSRHRSVTCSAPVGPLEKPRQEGVPPMSVIADVRAREILDSRGNPTVEVEVELDSGAHRPGGGAVGRLHRRARGGRTARRRQEALRRQGRPEGGRRRQWRDHGRCWRASTRSSRSRSTAP